MTRILFVCHGNICRSPMAEIVFTDMVHGSGLDFYVESRATSTEEISHGIGNPVYPPAKKELEKHGLFCGNKRAEQLKKTDYADYDLIIGMDDANIRNIEKICGKDIDGKVHKLMDYTIRPGNVSDPWFTDRFDIAYNDIYEGCAGLLKKLREGNG